MNRFNSILRRPRCLPFGIAALALTALSCDQPPVVRNCDFDAAVPCPNENNPAGTINGTIIYQGPVPRTDSNGVATGRIVLLLFDYNNPPAPYGTATTAVSFQALAASQLFADAQVMPDGTVFATTSYTFPNITTAGLYEIRAFYSAADSVTYDYLSSSGPMAVTAESGFQPIYSVRNQPVAGDVGGGAIVSATAAIPQFVPIPIGTPTGVDSDGNTIYTLPVQGFVASDITVFIGQVFTTDRPMFNVITDSTSPGTMLSNLTLTTAPMMPASALDPTTGSPLPGQALVDYALRWGLLPAGSQQLNMPRNYTVQDTAGGSDLPAFSITSSFVTGSGDPDTDECVIAANAGVLCASNPATQIGFFEQAFDRAQTGNIPLGLTAMSMPPFNDAHPTLFTTSPLASSTAGHLPWVFPLVILSKLHDPTPDERSLLLLGQGGTLTPQQYATLRQSLNQPETLDAANGIFPVIILGSVLPGGVAANLLLGGFGNGASGVENPARIGIIPIAIEIHGPNPATDWWVILPPATQALINAAQPFFPENYRCWTYDDDADAMAAGPAWPFQAGVPYGRYAINIFSPSSQSWGIPNELSNVVYGDCPPDGCHALSQSLVFFAGPAVPPAPAPAAPVFCPNPPACPGLPGCPSP